MWKIIKINKNNIKTETEKSVLIKMPNSSNYKGYTFWHPSKLVIKNEYNYSFIYNDNFSFKIFKTGRNFQKTSELNLSQKQMVKAFGIINNELNSEINKNKIKVTTPKIKKVLKIEVKNELKKSSKRSN